MVHRTDIAGGSTGQTSPGSDRTCRRALNGVLLENKLSHSSDNKKCCRLQTAAVPPVHAIYFELLTL